MKAILEYNMDEVDDRQAHLRAVKSLDMVLVLWEMDQELRSKIKYASDDTPDDVINTYEKIRTNLHQLLSEHGLDFDDLMR
jgi:hypothetical protein